MKKKGHSEHINTNINPGFEKVDSCGSIWRTPKKLVTRCDDGSQCPNCGKKLETGYTLVPIAKDNAAKVWGKECRNCGILFVKENNALIDMLNGNSLARDFTLNGEDLPSAERENERKERMRIDRILSNVDSAIVFIAVTTEYGKREYLITTDESKKGTSKSVLCYEEPAARELLTAAFHAERDKKGSIGGKEYTVIRTQVKGQSPDKTLSRLLINEITIRNGGGYYSADSDLNEEMVHLLLYSPFKDRYEIINATYDNQNGKSYIDYKRFREFAYQFGIPDMKVNKLFFNNGEDNGDWTDLNPESILRQFGYCVDRETNLTRHERRQVLYDLVDLEILTISQIVRYLDFFISTHRNDKFQDARNKWESDKQKISDYKFNRERFLIAEKRIPKTTIQFDD